MGGLKKRDTELSTRQDGSGKRKREERASGAGKKVRIGGPTRVDIVRGGEDVSRSNAGKKGTTINMGEMIVTANTGENMT